MRLAAVILRSYRSFHFDYRTKLSTKEDAFPGCKASWDTSATFADWRPAVEVPIHHPITSVVGLNEAGKSHLIDAVQKVVAHKEFDENDVCRYSEECRLAGMGRPIVGLRWDDLSEPAKDLIHKQFAEAKSKTQPETETEENAADEESDSTTPEEPRPKADVRALTLFGIHGKGARILAEDASGESTVISLKSPDVRRLLHQLPRVVRVHSNVFLPSRVSIESLFRIALRDSGDEAVQSCLSKLGDLAPFDSVDEFNAHEVNERDKLVYRILHHCANLDCDALCHVVQASDQLRKEFSSQATEQVEEFLNLSHWWAQDVDTHLSIDLQQDAILLNVTDRTGSWYGLAERSQGMRYFLGYVIQVLLELGFDNRPLLILSDEPDFALSAVGQRDLLRFFRKVVSYTRDGGACQIVLTTHSAELIDPNFPNRITILRKGLFDEGTYVVDKAHHRLFEPIRTALGGRGSSIPFIDGPNLVVEGDSDRVFVTRMSQHLAAAGKPHLDLAYLSIVIAQGGMRMPGIVTVAQSLPGDRAYLTILLDNDERGRNAESAIDTLDPSLKKNDQIVRVDSFLESGLGKDTEIEDLVPPEIYHRALLEVLQRDHPQVDWSRLPAVGEFTKRVAKEPTIDVIEDALRPKAGGPGKQYLDKAAILDGVFDMIESEKGSEAARTEFESRLEKMTGALLDRVNDNLRHKRHDEVRRTMKHLVKSFVHANGVEPSKARAAEVLERLRELGNRVSVSGDFDRDVDQVLARFKIRQGLRSDIVETSGEFLDALRSLPRKLTIDKDLVLM